MEAMVGKEAVTTKVATEAPVANEVRFTLPSLPITVNSLYQIVWSQRRVELKSECRQWKSESKKCVPRFRVSDGSSIQIDITFYFPFHYRNGKPRIFDVANLLKLTIDCVAEKCGFNDYRVRLGSWASVDSVEEKVEIMLREVVNTGVAPFMAQLTKEG